MHKTVSIEYLHECFGADFEAAALRWKARPPHHFTSEHAQRRTNARFTGKMAGTFSDGYLLVRIAFQMYCVHRILWAMANGRWPAEQIDHINHLRGDNRLTNLREASNKTNGQNQTLSRANTSGTMGVVWLARTRKWQARIKVNKKNRHLGYFSAKSDAIAARKAAEAAYGFHPNHGRAHA